MNIRTERPDDYEAVYSLVEQAFASAEHSDGTEQDLVAALRKGEAFGARTFVGCRNRWQNCRPYPVYRGKSRRRYRSCSGTALCASGVSKAGRWNRFDSGGPPDCQKTGICLLIGVGERNLLSALWVSACGIVRHRDPGRDATRKLFGDPPAGGCKASPWSGDLCKGIWHLRNVPKAGTFFRRT